MTDLAQHGEVPGAGHDPWPRVRAMTSRPAVRTAAAAVGLVLLTLAAYGSVIRHGGFVWDDDILLTANPAIPRADGLAIFWWPVRYDRVLARAAPDYWPLTWTTLWLEWRIWGNHPTGYHVTNILLHALSAVLLWRVLKALALPGAILAAAIFAVHPVCVPSVAWIGERKNTLSMVFYLLTLLAYARFDAQHLKRWYLLAVLAFAAAMLSKTQVIMAPVLLLGLAWWRRGRVTRRDVLAVAPLLALAAGAAAVTLWFHRQYALGSIPARPEGFFSRLAAAGMIPWFYLSKALVPVNLIMVYPRWNVSAAHPLSYVPGAALAAALVALWLLRKTPARALLAALGYSVIMLFPVLGFFEMSFAQISLVSDHLQYAALPGPIALVAVAVWLGMRRMRSPGWRLAGGAACVAVVLLLAGLTYARGLVFSSGRALWADVLTKNPSSPEAHYETGMHLTDDADQKRAAGDPSAATALLHEALEHYQEAIRLRPDYSEAHNNIGHIYIRLQDLPHAGYHFARAVEIRPDNQAARMNLAIAQYRIGATWNAADNFRRVLLSSPDYAPALMHLARILAADRDQRLRDGPQAVSLAQKACRLSPPGDALRVDCIDTLAMAYAEVGQFDRAIQTALQAAALARQIGRPALADEILARVALYERRQPVRILVSPPTLPAAPTAQSSTTAKSLGDESTTAAPPPPQATK
ncbi:MAG: tetratricopeptide repeat protein [Phycisphaerae bacterium]|nr:tetratricopeptide repeat protein [Phycisphaerae bacterium]